MTSQTSNQKLELSQQEIPLINSIKRNRISKSNRNLLITALALGVIVFTIGLVMFGMHRGWFGLKNMGSFKEEYTIAFMGIGGGLVILAALKALQLKYAKEVKEQNIESLSVVRNSTQDLPPASLKPDLSPKQVCDPIALSQSHTPQINAYLNNNELSHNEDQDNQDLLPPEEEDCSPSQQQKKEIANKDNEELLNRLLFVEAPLMLESECLPNPQLNPTEETIKINKELQNSIYRQQQELGTVEDDYFFNQMFNQGKFKSLDKKNFINLPQKSYITGSKNNDYLIVIKTSDQVFGKLCATPEERNGFINKIKDQVKNFSWKNILNKDLSKQKNVSNDKRKHLLKVMLKEAFNELRSHESSKQIDQKQQEETGGESTIINISSISLSRSYLDLNDSNLDPEDHRTVEQKIEEAEEKGKLLEDKYLSSSFLSNHLLLDGNSEGLGEELEVNYLKDSRIENYRSLVEQEVQSSPDVREEENKELEEVNDFFKMIKEVDSEEDEDEP
ncbi:MAG: hypothetical protein R3E91_02155 [Chlamydiales bacterium]